MSILDVLFGRQQPYGHWAWAGIQQQLHTRTFPQVGCSACEAEGWIPASKPAMSACQEAPEPDSTSADLARCVEALDIAVARLKAASRDPLIDQALGEFTLDALRGIRDAVEAEIPHAQP